MSVPLVVITPDDVRASIKRAKRSLEKAAEEIVWQIEMESWKTLQYTSWNAMREAEYGDAAFMVPRKDRPELVGRMRAAGLTNQEIANTAGVTEKTVRNDVRESEYSDSPSTVTNSRGEQRPASYSTREAETGPVTADPAPIKVTCPTCNGTGKVTQ